MVLTVVLTVAKWYFGKQKSRSYSVNGEVKSMINILSINFDQAAMQADAHLNDSLCSFPKVVSSSLSYPDGILKHLKGH